MTRIAILFLSLALSNAIGGWESAASAQTLTDLHAVRGDRLGGKLDGVPVQFRLAGVWVPTPPGTAEKADYCGREALEMVSALFETERVYIRPLGGRDDAGRILVAILVGEHDPRDLAVLLADAGYALWTPAAAVDSEHSQEIRDAERDARRGLRGMHDGGYQQFASTGAPYRDFGIEMWRPDWLRPGNGGVSLSQTLSLRRSASPRGSNGPRSSGDSRPQSRATWDHIARSSAWVYDAGLTGGR